MSPVVEQPSSASRAERIYSKLCQRLAGRQKQPVILVDRSGLDPRKQHSLLRASVAVEGRSLTLLEEIHPLSRKEKPGVHRRYQANAVTVNGSNVLSYQFLGLRAIKDCYLKLRKRRLKDAACRIQQLISAHSHA